MYKELKINKIQDLQVKGCLFIRWVHQNCFDHFLPDLLFILVFLLGNICEYLYALNIKNITLLYSIPC